MSVGESKASKGARGRAPDDVRLHIGGLDLRQTTFQFAKPLIDPDFPVPFRLRLIDDPEPSLEWVEVYAVAGAGSAGGGEEGDYEEGDYEDVDRPVADCLDEFVRLADAPDAQFERFARKWGVLGIWPRIRVERLGDGYIRVFYRETVDLWRRLVTRSRAILLVGADLVGGAVIGKEPQCAPPSDWEQIIRLDEVSSFNIAAEFGRSVAAQREVLSQVMTDLAAQINGHPYMVWEEAEAAPRWMLNINDWAYSWDMEYARRHPADEEETAADRYGPEFRSRFSIGHLALRPSPLYNIIVCQMAAALTSPKGLYRCDNCGEPFVPLGQRARADRSRYCTPWCSAEGHKAQKRSGNRERRSG